MDAQCLSTTPGARTATYRGQSRGFHPPALTVSAHSLTTPARPVAVMVPVSRPRPGPEPSSACHCSWRRSGRRPDPRQSLRLGAPDDVTDAEPCPADPGYVHSMSFRLARLGRRGLDEDDVPDFCARVEDELVRLLEERASFYAEVRRLRGRAQARNRAATVPAMLPFGTTDSPSRSRQFPSPVRSGSPAARRPRRSRSADFVPGVPARAGSRGSGSDARKRVRNINPSGFTLPTHPGTTPETPTAESTCQESERVVV